MCGYVGPEEGGGTREGLGEVDVGWVRGAGRVGEGVGGKDGKK